MISNAARVARIDLAAAFRLAVRFGLNEGIDNHFSLLVPGRRDRFLVNRFGLHWSEITASSLLTVDMDGKVVEGDGEVEATAFHIHSRLHQRSDRAVCVLHTHMPYATALGMVEGGRLDPASQNALRYVGDIAYDEQFNGLVLDTAEGDRLAAALDGKRILFLANHGVIVVGPTVVEAFDDLYFLERACMVQVLAMSTGRALKPVPPAIAEGTFGGFDNAKFATMHLDALKRLLDREEPDYAA